MSGVGAGFDGVAGEYDGDSFHRVVAWRLVETVAGDGPPGTVVDAGTGTGDAAFAAVRVLGARRVVAVDVSPGMIAVAREKAAALDPEGRIEWRVGDAVPAPVDVADLVVCASALHFLGRRAVLDWGRVLRPGGRVAFTLPSAETFRPSAEMAALLAPDIPIPASVEEAVAVAAEGGFPDAAGARIEAGGRAVFLVRATKTA
ncbi:class I SAM-dependent methyltransferase [Bailinhaonella thermotolerans]|uniref:Methyltransferase domain-containing protein n=1 Tax=Bailinhaonella thermotolerans TaxID=1070861 RepID=A0A3A4BD95_9ACTN|nr:methyltransferase domain-containing protein [Bailinhaonella thermotolerans]RJL32178.1 methyltransferase domain-containing protein [Bailinhaonella thermotolerans]